MDKLYAYNRIQELVGSRVRMDVPMAEQTTFRIGGPADVFAEPESASELAALILACRGEGFPYFIMGRGSNMLVSDSGYRGVIIRVLHGMDGIEVKEDAGGGTITAGAGALLSSVAAKALEAGLTGFEFAAGIPGTVGGACVMNAGAYGGEMKDVLVEAEAVTQDGQICRLSLDEMALGYRTSSIKEQNMTVTQAVIRLEKGDPAAIREKMDDLRDRRIDKQPLNYPSAGSTFKRPPGHFAGKLIEDAGLRGFQIGQAGVSEKHCGFVVNLGGATAEDVREVMHEVICRVREMSGVTLEPEVRFLGEFICAL